MQQDKTPGEGPALPSLAAWRGWKPPPGAPVWRPSTDTGTQGSHLCPDTSSCPRTSPSLQKELSKWEADLIPVAVLSGTGSRSALQGATAHHPHAAFPSGGWQPASRQCCPLMSCVSAMAHPTPWERGSRSTSWEGRSQSKQARPGAGQDAQQQRACF